MAGRRPPPVTASRWQVAAVWLAGVAPAVILPGGLNQFVFPKLAVVAAAVACALVARRPARVDREAVVVGAAGAVVLAAAAALGAAPLPQLVGRAPRYEGLVSLGLYAGSVAVGAWLLAPGAPAVLRRHLLRATSVASGLTAVLAVVEATGRTAYATTTSRPGSLLGNATEQGAYGVGVLALAIGLGLRSRRDPWTVVAAVSGATLVATSASRGAVLGLLVALGTLVVLGSSRLRRTALVSAAVALAVSLALPLTRDRLLLQSPLSRQTVSGRWTEWGETLQLLVHHPLLGVGPSGFVDAIPGVQSADYVRLAGTDRLDSPHSLLLQLVVSGGVVLLAVGVLGLVVLARAVRRLLGEDDHRGWTLAVVASLAGWLTVLLTHFTAPGSTPYFCLLAGSLLGHARTVERHPSWRRVGAGAAAVVSLVLVLAAVAEIPLRQGLVALQAGDGARAAGAFGAAHRLRPWDIDLDAAVVHALVAAPSVPVPTGVTAGYVARVTRSLAHDPSVLTDLGLYAAQSGRPQLALTQLDQAHRLAPQAPVVLLARGQVRARVGDLDGAASDLRTCAELTPRDPFPWRVLVSVYQQQGRDDLAAAAARKAATLSS